MTYEIRMGISKIGVENYNMLRKIHFSKKFWLCIIIFELVFLGTVFYILHQRSPVELIYTQDDLAYDSGEAGFYLDTSYSEKYIFTPEFTLPRGFYTLEAECESRGSTRIEVVYLDGQVNSNVSDVINLSDFPNISCEFRVGYGNGMMQVRGRMAGDAAEGDYILIRNIRIVSSPITVINTLFYIVVLFLVLDILLLGICYKEHISVSEETKTHIKILIVLIVVISIPLMVDYLFNGAHDLRFHLTRIEGIKEELLNGNFPVKMQTYWLHGHGYPVSIFYGDVLLYIPAILRCFGVSIQAAYQYYVLMINIGTVFISYYCFSKMHNAKTGLICTIVFSLNIFRLYDVYTRAAVGEYTAMMFMPLVLYGMWCIYMLPEESKEHGRSWIPLTIGCVGIFLSHILSTEMTAFFMILTALILWKKTFRKKTFIVLMKSAVLTLLLTIWFLVPFLDYMMSGTYVINDISRYSPYKLESRGTFPAQLFMNRYSVMQGSTGAITGVADDMPLTVGLASMLVLAGWFVFCFGKERDKTEKKEEYLAVFLSVLCLGMTLYFFPYTFIADKFPIVEMVVNSLQFSWRLYAVAGILLAWLLCIVLRKEWLTKKKKQVFAGVLVFIAFWQGISYMSDLLNEAVVFRVFQNGGLSTMDIVFAEYLPIDWGEDFEIVDYTIHFEDQLTYAEDVISVSDWHRDDGKVLVSLVNHSDQIQQMEVPLINYKGNHAFTDTGDELSITSGIANRISVLIPESYNGTIQVGFSEPWYWRLCELISLTTLFCLIIYPIVKKNLLKKAGRKLPR